MITLQDNDYTRPRRKYGSNIKLKVKKPWEVPTGHREERYTVMNNRPKRQRTRKDIERQWKKELE